MKEKKIPMRMCVGCREMKPKRELLRLVRRPDGSVVYDAGGKMSGRGAYICHDEECLRKAIKTRQFERIFECRLEEETIEKMTEIVKNESV